MASGDTLCWWEPKANDYPSANAASFGVRNNHPILEFDKDTDEETVFPGYMPAAYAGGGVTVILIWMADGVIVNEVVWDAQFERHEDDNFDLDGDGFAAVQSVTATAPSADGETSYDSITFTDGAQMDSLEAEESFRLKIRRDADNGADDLAADAQLLRIVLKET